MSWESSFVVWKVGSNDCNKLAIKDFFDDGWQTFGRKKIPNISAHISDLLQKLHSEGIDYSVVIWTGSNKKMVLESVHLQP